MSLQILDATTRAAVAAATAQQTQCEALIAAWGGGNVTARLFTSGGSTLLRTLTLGPFTVNTSTPRGVVCAGVIADTHVATGVPGLVVFRSGSTDIFSIDAGTSGASVNFAGNIKQLCTPTLSGVVFTAQPGLPLTPVPSWRVGMAVGEIKNLTSASDTAGAALNAWGTLVLIDGTATLVSPANGGHTDSSDNRVTSIDLTADAPSWTVRIAASTAPFPAPFPDTDYFADGKPNSRHGYTHAHYIAQRSRVMLFGAEGTWESGGATYNVDGISHSGTWAWDAAGTYASLAADRGFGQGRVPSSGNVWTNGGWRWTQATNTWDQPITQQIGGSGIRSPWAWDSTRENFFSLQWRDGRNLSGSGVLAHQINATTGAITAISFNSSSAYTQWQADGHQYSAMVYDPVNDCFYFYSGQTYNSSGETQSQVPTRIYKITPNGTTTWDMSTLTVTGDTPANVTGNIGVGGPGINGRFVYVPAYNGVFCQPAASAAPWFLRTS